MKLRTDFVTNSSSSSYIIAIRDDATVEDIRAFLGKYRTEAADVVDTYELSEYGYDDDFPEGLTEDEYIDILISVLTDELFQVKKSDFKIENWHVDNRVVYSEEFTPWVMLDYIPNVDTDKIKIGGECC